MPYTSIYMHISSDAYLWVYIHTFIYIYKEKKHNLFKITNISLLKRREIFLIK